MAVGVEHIAFTYGGPDDLFQTYERLKADGITPYWTINHGPTLSFYYRDPDLNQVELQIDLQEDAAETNEWFELSDFNVNPIGVRVDAEDIIRRYRSGEDRDQLFARPVIAPDQIAAQLPTVFGRSLDTLEALLEKHRPALAICVGQAGGRAAISLERVAININDARIADNAFAQPVDTPVHADGPAAYFTTLPVKAMMLAVRREGVAAEISQTAGTFVCNHVFYGLMHALATLPALQGTRGGFIHVPWLGGQGTPSMPLDELVRGLRAAVRSALETRTDVAAGAGAEH